MDEKTCALINLISAASGKYGDKLIEYMNEYNLPALTNTTCRHCRRRRRKR